MLNIPEEIKELFKSDNIFKQTQKKFKLTFYDDTIDSLYPYETLFPDEGLFPSEHGEPWLVIENNRIESESLTITESLSESEDMEFGSCESSVMEIVVADVIEDVTGREFTLTVEIGGYEMALGIYTVDSLVRQADRRKRKITAYDRMIKFDADVSNWYNDLKFPITLKSFRNSLCDYIGVPQNEQSLPLDSMPISKTIEPEEISGKDVLKAICQINGCFGHVDKTGVLTYKFLQRTGLYPAEDLYPEEDLYPSEFGGDGNPVEVISRFKQGATYEDYLVEGITGLSIRQEENDIGANVGDGYNSYAIEGNFLVYGKSAADLLSIAETLLPVIEDRVYRPANIECNARPWVEVGDAIRVLTKDDIIETFVIKRTIKGCQAMFDTIESTGSPKREEVFGINKQILQLEGKSTVIIKNVEGISVRVTDLKAQEEAHFEITSNKITAEVNRATEAEGSLSSRITQTADQIQLKVSKGDVTSELNSELKITGNSIELKTGHFTIDSKNLTLDNNGNAIFSGNLSAAGGTFNGDVTVTGFSESKYPLKMKNNANAYFGVGGTGFLLAKYGRYIMLDYSLDASMPRLYGGSYTSINEETFALSGVDNDLYLDSDGMFKSIWTRRHKTEDVSNVHISTEGYFYRVSSSSRRYKKDESTDLRGINPHGLYKTPIKTYKYKDGYLEKNDPGEGKYILGMIVEDLLETFPEAVSYEGGQPETWKERIMIPAMLKLIQEQNERLIRLEERL